FKVTERGRHAAPDSPFYRERWLLCSSRDEQAVVFASDQDISVMYESPHLIMDGTFKVAPDEFMQIYTIHAWGNYGHEAIPVAHAVMHSKTAASYAYVLSQIRQKLEAAHGGIGAIRFMHTDYEHAAHIAIRQIFPDVILKGCNFHFGQAINRKLQQIGLRFLWNDAGLTGEWLGCLKALAMLPSCLIRPAFVSIIGYPPVQQDDSVQAKLLAFRGYFENTWLNGNFPIDLWCQWDNSGPRTTNHAEGYHNRLNMIDLRDMNLAMRNFLHLLQPLHNRDQIRVRNLRRRVFQPKQRDQTYVELDDRIEAAKQRLVETTEQFWNIPDFNPDALPQNDFHVLMAEVHRFLRCVRFLIGKKSRVVINIE
uniref:MULE transposase domain-containing protein n=1 Tax=Romanomermis culicivorax TaxID=13658 RepID=A0A915JDF0_ROMCU